MSIENEIMSLIMDSMLSGDLSQRPIGATVNMTYTNTTQAGSRVRIHMPMQFEVRTPHMLFGQDVFVMPSNPRYVLPDEVIPGVPWPAGFKKEIDDWSRDFLGSSCILKPGEIISAHGSLYMDEATFLRMRDACFEFENGRSW